MCHIQTSKEFYCTLAVFQSMARRVERGSTSSTPVSGVMDHNAPLPAVSMTVWNDARASCCADTHMVRVIDMAASSEVSGLGGGASTSMPSRAFGSSLPDSVVFK